MRLRNPVQRGAALATALALVVQLGCGTMLYPERHGRRSGSVDPGVIAMDGLLLIFFVVPGLVAFAVDFHTGSVYVRNGDRHSVLQLEIHERTEAGVEKRVSAELGREIRLRDLPQVTAESPPEWTAHLLQTAMTREAAAS